MLKKLLSTVGIGSARVDTQLSKTTYRAGDYLEGVIVVYGGNVEQRIDEIYLSLMSTYTRLVKDNKVSATAVLEKYQLVDPFVIKANEVKRIPLRFALPHDVPVTKGGTKVWIQTGMDIKMAIDPKDKDYIQVLPHPLVESFLKASKELGFKLYEVNCEEAPRAARRKYPFVQEFEFKATSGIFGGLLDELEAVFFVSEDQVEVVLEIDRKSRGFGGFISEAFRKNDSVVKFTYGPQEVNRLPQLLSSVISRFC